LLRWLSPTKISPRLIARPSGRLPKVRK
jgi:hypothetical protein